MARLLVSFLILFATLSPVHATEAGWALMREGGHVVLLRHGYAGSGGDPAAADLDDCRTQRGLSDRGKTQARRIGSLFAARAETVETVYTSRYCRTRETASIAFGDQLVEDLPALDPTPDTDARAAADEEIEAIIAGFRGAGNLVLVTDESVIRGLTGTGAREGEAVIVAPQAGASAPLRVLGRIVFN